MVAEDQRSCLQDFYAGSDYHSTKQRHRGEGQIDLLPATFSSKVFFSILRKT